MLAQVKLICCGPHYEFVSKHAKTVYGESVDVFFAPGILADVIAVQYRGDLVSFSRVVSIEAFELAVRLGVYAYT